jgi:photosystem II stability/assembly factor-like uncharacterized protein
MTRTRLVRLLSVPIALGGVALAVALLSGGSSRIDRAALLRTGLDSPGGTEAGEVSLSQVEQYFHTRLTYPTGRFESKWVLAAARQAKKIPTGIPSGTYRPWRGSGLRTNAAGSRAVLSAARPLGPQPQASTGCQAPCFTFGLVSGRVSAVAFDPVTTSTAYIAQDGGGIWKTTNCCSPATTWTPTTDGTATTAVDDVTVDPNHPNTVYAATGDISFGSYAFGSAGVLKSTDGGGHWTVVGPQKFAPLYPVTTSAYPQYQAVTKVRVDPNNSQNVVVGTKTGLYVSNDAGTNWTGPCLTNSFTSQRQDVTDLILRDDGTTTSVFAAIGARGFATFVQQNLGQNGANGVYRLARLPVQGCPAVSSWVPMKSGWPTGTAGGVPCNPPIGDGTTLCKGSQNKLGRIEMAIAPNNPKVLYAEVQAVDPQPGCGVLQLLGETTARGCFLGLWRTADGGNTWTKMADHKTMDFPGGTTTAGPCGEDTPQMWYDMGLAVDPNNSKALFLDAIDIWKSTDGGKTLTDISCGYYTGLNPISAPVHVDNHVLAYQPGSSTNLLAGNDGGIYVSNNAANAPEGTADGVNNPPTFKDVNATMNTIEFYSGDISQNFATATNPFIVAGAQDNGSSFYQFAGGSTCPPAGCQWSQRIGGDGFFARIEPKQGQRVFMESQNGALQRSTTGPAGPYQAVGGGWGADPRSFIFPYEIDKFACPTPTCDHMIAGSNRVWESIDGGTTWNPNSPNLTKNTLGDRSYINQLSYAPTTNGNAIVGTNDGNVQYGFGLGTGTANTANWVNLTGGNQVLPNRPIQDVTISPQNPLVGYAAIGGFKQNTPNQPGHVYQVTCTTFCASFTWVDKTGNLPNIPADSIMINPNVPKQAFVGTDWGLYYTDDITKGSPVWNQFGSSLPHTMIWDMSIDRGATTLAVFTRSRGAWAIPLPTVSATQQTLFSDDFETAKPWVVTAANTCKWNKDTTSGDAHSGSVSWTTHPYGDNCNTDFTSPAITVPANVNTIRLTFWQKHDSEDGTNGGSGCPCDFGQVSLSTDGGATYQSIGNPFSGTELAYSQATIPLPQSAAGKTIKLRFHFQSDGSVSDPVHQGWYVDDVLLTGEPN